MAPNRTKLELKQVSRYIAYSTWLISQSHQAGIETDAPNMFVHVRHSLPIAPSWNWNRDGRNSWTLREAPNRTKLELKQKWNEFCLFVEEAPNRTKLELKRDNTNITIDQENGSQSHQAGIET